MLLDTVLLALALAPAPAATTTATTASDYSIAATTTATTATDYSIAAPIAGNWSYAALADGSEARFADGGGNLQFALRCTRSLRRVTLSKPAAAGVPSMLLWTSGVTRTLAPGFDTAAGRLNATLGAFDPLLDAMVFSRGRIAIVPGSGAALVVPPWPEIARVVEDCRV